MDEELTLPSPAPKMAQLLRFSLQPEIIDRKVLSGKVAFRGAVVLHVLYKGEDEALHSWDFELPFAQYAELEQDYEQEATSSIILAVTSLELDRDPEGRLHLQAGFTGQYVVADRTPLEIVEDAYSPGRTVAVQHEELYLPAILEEQMQTVSGEQTISLESSRIVDAAFYPDQPRVVRNGDAVTAELSGHFQLLCCDENGTLRGSSSKWNGNWTVPADPNCRFRIHASPSGIPQGIAGEKTEVKADTLLYVQTDTDQAFPMVAALELGPLQEPEGDRPSLIIRRAGNNTLWEIAKSAGSTEKAIREINQIEDEIASDQMLLIPII